MIPGTYNGYTWFEAAILRPSQCSDRAEARLWLDRAVQGPIGVDAALGYEPTLEVMGERNSRWRVQKNFTASREFREHVVVWDADGTATPGPEAGAGDGEGFVHRLETGDRIGVIARAMVIYTWVHKRRLTIVSQFLGWANFVERAEVSVYYSLA
jgi:hypothetical protein